jgi:ABC-type dipeptide/oligopeptide/nickel transport system ATPase component
MDFKAEFIGREASGKSFCMKRIMEALKDEYDIEEEPWNFRKRHVLLFTRKDKNAHRKPY